MLERHHDNIHVNKIIQVDPQKYSYAEKNGPLITLTYVNDWQYFLFTYSS